MIAQPRNPHPASVWHGYGRRLAVTSGLCLAASAAAAQTGDSPAENRVRLLLGVIETAGCVVTEENNLQILADAGMTEAEASDIVLRLFADGRAVPQGDDLRVLTGICA